MNTEKAIQKIEKSTGLKMETNNKGNYWIQGNKYILSFLKNGEYGITCIHIRRIGDESDIRSDYFAGFFVDNITQALRHFN